MTPGFGKPRSELPWLPYESKDQVIINAHNFTPAASPLLTDLISYWKMDEVSGNAVDSHGTNTLTPDGTGTIGTAAGKIATSRSLLAASAQSFSIADNASVSLGDIDCTITGWFNATTLPVFDFVSKDIEAGSDREYLVGYNGSRMRFGVFSSAGAFTQVVANTFGGLSTGTWYFIAAWHDAVNNVLGISVNGTADTLSYSNGIRDAAARFAIGSRGAISNRLDGSIDEIGLWKRMLTSGERSQIYNAGSGLAYPFS
jgi:hypothetical protein